MSSERPRFRSDYEEALSGVIDRAREIESASGATVSERPSLLARPAVGIGVLIVFVGVLIFNVRFAAARRPVALEPVPVEAAPVSVVIAAQAVETYRAEHGHLPESLEEIGIGDPHVEYLPSADGDFTLATVDGAAAFDSREGPEAILRTLGVTPREIR